MLRARASAFVAVRGRARSVPGGAPGGARVTAHGVPCAAARAPGSGIVEPRDVRP